LTIVETNSYKYITSDLKICDKENTVIKNIKIWNSNLLVFHI